MAAHEKTLGLASGLPGLELLDGVPHLPQLGHILLGLLAQLGGLCLEDGGGLKEKGLGPVHGL